MSDMFKSHFWSPWLTANCWTNSWALSYSSSPPSSWSSIFIFIIISIITSSTTTSIVPSPFNPTHTHFVSPCHCHIINQGHRLSTWNNLHDASARWQKNEIEEACNQIGGVHQGKKYGDGWFMVIYPLIGWWLLERNPMLGGWANPSVFQPPAWTLWSKL